MASTAEEIREYMASIAENSLIDASRVYHERYESISEKTYYKVLERMVQGGALIHLAKGIYYRPRMTRYGVVPIGENETIEFYTANDRGVVLGYPMYNRYGLTTQVGKSIRVLSNNVAEEKRKVGNVIVERASVEISSSTMPVIETLDILQNYFEIEDLSLSALASYLSTFTEIYSDTVTAYVLENRKYKKRTIAFMKAVLDYNGVSNTLSRYLSSLSNYKIPPMDEIFEPLMQVKY